MARYSKAVVLEEPNKFVIKNLEIPELRPDGAILRVEMVSICSSDKKLMDGTHARASFPKILGHEIVGVIDSLGEEARKAYGVEPGDRVTIEPYVGCTTCKACLTGDYQAHMPYQNYGTGLTCDHFPYLLGGYSEYMYLLPGTKMYKIDKSVPAEAACLSSIIGNGVRWVRTKGKVKYGDSVVILGSGALGLASLVAAKESGAYPIIVCGISNDRVKFELAREMGADYIINTQEQNLYEEVKRITSGRMCDLVIEACGAKPMIQAAYQLACTSGKVVMSGLTGGKEIPVVTDKIVNEELTVYGGHGQAWDVEDACRIINSGKYPIEKMISHVFKLDDVEEAMAFFKSAPPECIRCALVP